MSNSIEIKPPTALSSWMRGLASHLKESGIEPKPLFEEQGLDFGLLEASDGRYPVSATTRVWQKAVELTGDESIGLKAIRYITPSNFHFVGMGVLASGTIREAFERLTRFHDLITDASELKTANLQDGSFELSIQIKKGCEPADQSLDGLIALLANLGKGLGAPHLKPLWVDLTRVSPGEALAPFYLSMFGCEVHYAQPMNRLVFAADSADAPLQGANALIAAHLDQASSLAIQRIKPVTTTSETASKWIESRLTTASLVSIDLLADELHMSTRNLQRKLAEEGAQFQTLLEDARRRTASKLIRETKLPLTHIALDLGFSDVSSFSRACKRWFGASPKTLRDQASNQTRPN